jgi:hypothetical protein
MKAIPVLGLDPRSDWISFGFGRDSVPKCNRNKKPIFCTLFIHFIRYSSRLLPLFYIPNVLRQISWVRDIDVEKAATSSAHFLT